MKRILSLCLFFSLLASLLGCSSETSAPEDTAQFFYLRTSYVYGAEDGVMTPEARDISNRRNSMVHLLTLYLQGPLDSELRSPFPAGCKLQNVTLDGSTLCVTLDSSFAKLKDMELTLACACMAKTCFSLFEATQVQIQAESENQDTAVNVVISIDNLLLDDNSGLPQQSVTEDTK